ncbi:hypothetical protein [Neptunomonas japonica]|uniref:Uncharacterized protein n=1 Tax=Neptunomonas japonica JAMM 1380 TaxID=1441457 RepID=A0A7R6PBR1_9GAMM|nr:hypothetical protein [Neptunomonas japonica]BBB30784.1 conserved hypothetical protein [Neptunomonas japonica JAMM 1380]
MKLVKIAVISTLLTLTISSVATAEPQPLMEAALKSLEKAKWELKHASNNKGGHKIAAIINIDKAIKATRKGIRYDNKH